MTDLSPGSWNERYQTGDTPWDLDGPTPEFVRLLDEGRLGKKGHALVPGGGRGHDAILLAQRGFEVDVVDFAPAALRAMLEKAAEQKTVVYAYRQNFFDLPQVAYHQRSYDLLLEYTFFCAIAPEDRPRYVRAAAELLRPGGLLAAIFYPLTHDKPGPPFVVSQSEVVQLFTPYFEIHVEEPRQSVKRREGREFLGLFRRKN